MDQTNFVLDSSAFLSGKDLSGFQPSLTTEGVLGELVRLGREEPLTRCPWLQLAQPGPQAMEQVKEASRRTGDMGRLSRTDSELVALSLELGATLISDDYSIQNVALELGVKVLSLSERGIQEKRNWTLRCRGCGRYFQDERLQEKGALCPVCGSGLRKVRKRR